MRLLRVGSVGAEKPAALQNGKVYDLSSIVPDRAAIPDEPILFMKATSSICGPNHKVILLRDSKKTDWEVELGVVIGRPGSYIEEENAYNDIAGYCVINDLSEREYQLERGGNG
jgi:2-keto-4-pentenoate hydratase/2-oxohepta-3-ene-1,7-dioic acid hydratase in catechol pathway